MSKLKFSFSLIIALFLVGILSTSAFAKDPYSLKPVQVQGTTDLSIPFSLNGQTSVDLYVNDSAGVDQLGATNGKGVTASPIVVKGLTPGVVYNVVLFAGGADPATATPLSKSSGIVIEPHNGALLNGDNGATKAVYGSASEVITLDKNGTGLKNDNLTGFNNTRKQRAGQKVHGFYQNNTNSCASCHQTHTAADGEYLLFKDGVYSTCSACHDGTTGAYNSFAPATADTPNEIAGTFDVKTSGHNGSLHEADGSLQVSAAPGGNNDVAGSANTVATATYGAEFDCASCHAAHGNGSAGENNLNADPLGWAGIQYATTNNDTKNGKLFKGLTVETSVPTTFKTPYILVKTTVSAVLGTFKDANKQPFTDVSATNDKTVRWIFGRAGATKDDKLIQTYRWDGNKYVVDFSLWMKDSGHVSAPFANANTVLYKADSTNITGTNMTMVWKDGFAFGAGVDDVATADLSVGIDVETTNDIATLFDSNNTNYVYDSGTEMSKYCAACHIDYLSTTRGNDTGVYTKAHRHATAQDKLSCVRCHFGHGSEAKIMKDANDQSYFDKTAAGMTDADAINYLVDPNPSSALKRYTGMSVCYACHGKGSQFAANPNNKDIPKAGDPGAARTSIQGWGN